MGRAGQWGTVTDDEQEHDCAEMEDLAPPVEGVMKFFSPFLVSEWMYVEVRHGEGQEK